MISDCLKNLSLGSESVFWLLVYLRNVAAVFIYVGATHYTSDFFTALITTSRMVSEIINDIFDDV